MIIDDIVQPDEFRGEKVIYFPVGSQGFLTEGLVKDKAIRLLCKLI